jgi:predicted kinase
VTDRLDRPVLVLVSGLPGSSKTTHAHVCERRLSAIRLSADDWLEALADDLWDEDARDTELHYLAASCDVLYQRVARRGRDRPAVGRQQVRQWQTMFEAPAPDETRFWDHFESIDTETNGR